MAGRAGTGIKKKYLWPTSSLTSPATRQKLSKAYYTRLREFEPLRSLSDKTLRKVACIAAEDLNRLCLDHMIQLHHFRSDKGRLGLAFEYEGKQYSITSKELEKLKAYISFRIDSPSPYTADDWQKCLAMTENVTQGRTFYEETKRSYHHLSRTVGRVSDIRGYTEFVRRVIDCINDDINPNKQPRRYKEEVFSLGSYVLQRLSRPGDTIYLTPEQIKGRINKDLPRVKKEVIP